MNKNLLKWDETLFRDPDVFELSYVPEQFNYREEQTELLAFAVRPGLRGGRILDVVCRGPPATGKTTSVKKIFELVREMTDKVVPVHVNCKVDSTEFAVICRIYAELTNQSPPTSGTSLKQILDLLAHYIRTQKIQPLVCLDDANYLVYQNQFLDVIYPIVRMHEAYPDINIGLIVVLSDESIDLVDVLDIRTRSTFHPDLIEFPPYSAREMAGILNARVNAGLYPHVLPPEIMDRIVDLSKRQNDVRFGLNLIKRVVLLAEQDGRKTVTVADMEKTVDMQLNFTIVARLKSLAADERLVMVTIIDLLEDKEKISTKEIEQALPAGKNTPKKTRLAEIFTRMSQLELIDLSYENLGGGRRRYVSLHFPFEETKHCLDVAQAKMMKNQ